MKQINKRGFLGMLSLSAVIAGGVAFGTATAAVADVLDGIMQRGKIIVASQAESPGLSSMNAQGEFQGIDIDVAKRYAEFLGVEIEFIPVNNQSRIAAVQTGKVDVVFGALSMTAERAKSVQYSRPYTPNFNVVIGPPDQDMPDLDSLKGKSIGVSKGSTMDIAVTEAAPPEVTIRRFDDESSTMQAYLSRQADAAAFSAFFLPRLEAVQPGSAEAKFPLSTLYVGAGMKLGEKKLNESINGFLDTLEADGTLAALYEKWAASESVELPKSIEGVPYTVE